MQPEQVVVLDNGGCTCKVGIAGQQHPLYVPFAVFLGPDYVLPVSSILDMLTGSSQTAQLAQRVCGKLLWDNSC